MTTVELTSLRSRQDLIHMLNYLTNCWSSFKEHQFLGFIPAYKDAQHGIVLDGVNYLGVHVFFCDEQYLCQDVKFKEKPYILMFGAGDDLSYAKRYKTKAEAILFFRKQKEFTNHIKLQCLMYN